MIKTGGERRSPFLLRCTSFATRPNAILFCSHLQSLSLLKAVAEQEETRRQIKSHLIQDNGIQQRNTAVRDPLADISH